MSTEVFVVTGMTREMQRTFGRLRRSTSVNGPSAVVRRDIVSQARGGKLPAHLIGCALPPSRLPGATQEASADKSKECNDGDQTKRLTAVRQGTGELVHWRGSHRSFDPARITGASVTFEPGARTAWHTHPLGQDPACDDRLRMDATRGRAHRRDPSG
jgi:hypothetical protein